LPTITTLQQKQNNTRLEYVFLFLSNILEMLHLPIFTEFTEGHQTEELMAQRAQAYCHI